MWYKDESCLHERTPKGTQNPKAVQKKPQSARAQDLTMQDLLSHWHHVHATLMHPLYSGAPGDEKDVS